MVVLFKSELLWAESSSISVHRTEITDKTTHMGDPKMEQMKYTSLNILLIWNASQRFNKNDYQITPYNDNSENKPSATGERFICK